MHEEDSAKIWVGSVIICCNQSCTVKASIFALSYDILSCLYQFFNFILKSPKTTIRNGLWLAISLRVNSRLSANWSTISVGWLADGYKEIKLHSLFAINTWEMIHSWRYLIANISKLMTVCNICRHHFL